MKHFQYKLLKTPKKGGGKGSSSPPVRPPGNWSKGSGAGTFLITHLGDFPPEAGTQAAFQATSSQEPEEDKVFQ